MTIKSKNIFGCTRIGRLVDATDAMTDAMTDATRYIPRLCLAAAVVCAALFVGCFMAKGLAFADAASSSAAQASAGQASASKTSTDAASSSAAQASADQASAIQAEANTIAVEITDLCEMTLVNAQGTSQPLASRYRDANYNSYGYLDAGTSITVSTTDGSAIGALYVVFNYIPQAWVLTAGERQIACGSYGFIHEYVDQIGQPSVTLAFSEQTQLCDVYVFGSGQAPDWVQVWQPPEGRADILFCPTHSDDDQLYLGGIIPTAINAGYTVQTAYLVNHWQEWYRPHEMLNSLWNNGLVRYPVMGYLPDFISYDTLLNPDRLAAAGWTHEDLIGHLVELIRKYQPQIAICHSLTGEYGHAAHILYAKSMQEAVIAASEVSQYPQSAQQYGTWDVPKTYLHEYPEHQIMLDLDVPLEMFGGRTAFQIMQESFAMHISQMKWDGFRNWVLRPARAADIRLDDNSPCLYGLWRTAVGDDTFGNTMFEHITSYAQQEQLAIQAAEIQARNTLMGAIATGIVVVIAAIAIIVLVARHRKKIAGEGSSPHPKL